MKLSSSLLFLFLSPIPFNLVAHASYLRVGSDDYYLGDDDDPSPPVWDPTCSSNSQCGSPLCCLTINVCGVGGGPFCKFEIDTCLPFFVDCEKMFSNTMFRLQVDK